jgi:hypothetical protein
MALNKNGTAAIKLGTYHGRNEVLGHVLSTK